MRRRRHKCARGEKAPEKFLKDHTNIHTSCLKTSGKVCKSSFLDPPRQFASVRKGQPPSPFTFRTILAAKEGLTWRKFPYSPKWSFTATLFPSLTTKSNPAAEKSSSSLSRTFISLT